MAERRILIAAVAGAFGVRGEVRLKSFTADPAALASYGPLETEDGARRFAVTALRPLQEGLAARLEGIATREAAAALRGMRLYVPRAALPEPGADEFYHADLLGLVARSPAGERLGEVIGVPNYGAGDLLEIARAGGPSLLVPFTREVVPEIDIAAGHLLVVLPAEGPEEDDGPHTDGKGQGA